MRNFGIIDEQVSESLHQYFAQCSGELPGYSDDGGDARNMGTNPIRERQVFDFQYVRFVLTVMFTCGLYDYAGGWAFEVGLPAKSGVSGGICGVVNRQLGVSVYSPKLDEQGNSVRGILACKDLAAHLGLHAFEFTNVGSSFMAERELTFSCCPGWIDSKNPHAYAWRFCASTEPRRSSQE